MGNMKSGSLQEMLNNLQTEFPDAGFGGIDIGTAIENVLSKNMHPNETCRTIRLAIEKAELNGFKVNYKNLVGEDHYAVDKKDLFEQTYDTCRYDGDTPCKGCKSQNYTNNLEHALIHAWISEIEIALETKQSYRMNKQMGDIYSILLPDKE